MPYADNPAGGVLGVYVTVARQRAELVKFVFNVARGKWRDNEHVEIHQADRTVLKIHSGSGNSAPSWTVELVKLDRETTIEIQPGA